MAPENSTYEITYHNDDVIIVKLVGMIDSDMAKSLKFSIDSLQKEEGYILFTLEDTEFVSTAALSLLLKWKKGKNIVFYNVPDDLKEQMQRVYDVELFREMDDKDFSEDGKTIDDILDMLIKRQNGSKE